MTSVPKSFETFIEIVSHKYNISVNTLKDTVFPNTLKGGKSGKGVTKKTKKEENEDKRLRNAINFILEENVENGENETVKPKKVASVSGKTKETKKNKKILFKPRDVCSVIQKLCSSVSKISIRKNDKGFYVHEETNLVFDPVSQKAIGRWKDSQVKWLTKDDILKCIELDICYELPENLDTGIVIDKIVEEVLGEDDFKEEMSEDDEDIENDEDE